MSRSKEKKLGPNNIKEEGKKKPDKIIKKERKINYKFNKIK